MIEDDQKIYWQALERIVQGQPMVVPLGETITFDLVCLEAGRGRGSLKASRLQHRAIREAITDAAAKQLAASPKVKKALAKQKSDTQKDAIAHYRALYEAALGRELMLLRMVDTLEFENAELRKPKIVKFAKQ